MLFFRQTGINIFFLTALLKSDNENWFCMAGLDLRDCLVLFRNNKNAGELFIFSVPFYVFKLIQLFKNPIQTGKKQTHTFVAQYWTQLATPLLLYLMRTIKFLYELKRSLHFIKNGKIDLKICCFLTLICLRCLFPHSA